MQRRYTDRLVRVLPRLAVYRRVGAAGGQLRTLRQRAENGTGGVLKEARSQGVRHEGMDAQKEEDYI